MYPREERDPVPLTLLHWPLCFQFHLFPLNGDAILVDATAAEEAVCDGGEVIVATNAQGEVCMAKKLGGEPADALTLLRVVELAVRKVQEVERQVKDALERDARERDKEGLMKELSAENER